jgi:hypothetical protein
LQPTAYHRSKRASPTTSAYRLPPCPSAPRVQLHLAACRYRRDQAHESSYILLSTGLAGAASSDGHIERFDCNASLASGLVSDINELECEGTLLAGLAWAKTRTQDGARLVLFSDNSPTVGWLRKGRRETVSKPAPSATRARGGAPLPLGRRRARARQKEFGRGRDFAQ